MILNDPDLSDGLMRISIPEGIEKGKIEFNSFDLDVLKTVNSNEFFLYPYNKTHISNQLQLIEVNDVKQRKYFLLKDNKFRFYQGDSIVNLSPFFFSYFPRFPQSRMWVMLCNNHQDGSLEIINGSNEIRLSEISTYDYKSYLFDSVIPKELLFRLKIGGNESITGVLGLKKISNTPIVNHKKAHVAIDLGTSNTYITYSVEDVHVEPQDIEYTPNEMISIPYIFDSAVTSGDFIEKNGISETAAREHIYEIYRSFFPLHLRAGTSHKLPTYTALKVVDKFEHDENELSSLRFGFHYVNDRKDEIIGDPDRDGKRYLTEIKWIRDGFYYKKALNVIHAFVEAYLHGKYQLPMGNISWMITQPQSLYENESYRPGSLDRRVLRIDEAIAPLFFVRQGNRVPRGAMVVNIDIGGGTIDIGVILRTNSEKEVFFKTSCLYGFNRLLEQSPVYDETPTNIWPDFEDGEWKERFEKLSNPVVLRIKKTLSKNGLPDTSRFLSVRYNLLLYYTSIIWFVSKYLKILIEVNEGLENELSEGIYLQFTGQGSNFIRNLMINKGEGRDISGSPFREYEDSLLHSFHELFFGNLSDKIKVRSDKIKVRLSRESDSKKVTARGALLSLVKTPVASNDSKLLDIKSEIVMGSQRLGEFSAKSESTHMDKDIALDVKTVFNDFMKIINSIEFTQRSGLLFDLFFDDQKIEGITSRGYQSIDSIDRALNKDAGNVEEIARFVGAKNLRGAAYRLESSPLLWPFYGIFQRF
jgi:hypothetical protein